MKSRVDIKVDPVDQIVARLKEVTKYCDISEVLIRRIATQEINKRNNFRAAMKATRNKLHQVGGAYLDRPLDYDNWLVELKVAFMKGKDDFLRVCRQVMCYHSSTRERLPDIDQFFYTLLAELPPARRVLDVACGLNPLAIPWMGLPEDVEYLAVDIYSDMINFINQFMGLAGIHGSAWVGDVITDCPTYPVDIAFVLKTIPCLEQVEKNTGVRLLNSLQAKHIVVSFPVYSLGGRRGKGMLENYTKRFNEIMDEKDWYVKRFEYASELVFIVSKP
jgi:16S rRNA (guanine(1405)-N(7))-methyltransferase